MPARNPIHRSRAKTDVAPAVDENADATLSANETDASRESADGTATPESTDGAATPESNDGADGSSESSDPETLRRQVEEKNAEIERLKEEVGEKTDQLLRALADLENVRRRGRQEREEIAQFGLQDIMRDLLPVIDNFERALVSDSVTVESLLEGVRLTLRQLHEVLGKHGVEPVPGVGEPFDARHHEAIMRAEPSEDFPSGTVVDEIRKGYSLNGRLLRPSLVKVAQEE